MKRFFSKWGLVIIALIAGLVLAKNKKVQAMLAKVPVLGKLVGSDSTTVDPNA